MTRNTTICVLAFVAATTSSAAHATDVGAMPVTTPDARASRVLEHKDTVVNREETAEDETQRRVELHFPRVEVYSEQDHGRADAGVDVDVGSDGVARHMGRAHHQPFVERASYLLDETDTPALLASKLVLLPYFKETRPEASLADYVDAAVSPHLPAWRALFPRHLEGLKSHGAAERGSFDSLVEYQGTAPSTVVIVWLASDRWYVDHVFYRAELETLLQGKTPVVEQRLMAGTLTDFIRFSPVVQAKLDEGFRELRVVQPMSSPAKDDVVLIVAKTPGGPGSESYQYTLAFNGGIAALGHGGSRGPPRGPAPPVRARVADPRLSHHLVAGLLIAAQRLDLERGLAAAAPPVHDGQSIMLRAWKDGVVRTVTFGPGGSPMPAPISAYFEAARDTLIEAQLEPPTPPPTPPK